MPRSAPGRTIAGLPYPSMVVIFHTGHGGTATWRSAAVCHRPRTTCRGGACVGRTIGGHNCAAHPGSGSPAVIRKQHRMRCVRAIRALPRRRIPMTVHPGERLDPAAGPVPAPTGAETVVKQYVDDLTLALAQLETGSVTDLLETLVLTLHSGRRVFVAGNGGSSTAAIHIASDLMAAAGTLGGAPQVVALTENIARITAIANDHCYDEIFSRQLTGWGRPRDALLLLSVSGHSANLVRAARVGRDLGMTVLAALGNAGEVARLADRLVVFGQADYGLTEDLHVALGHMAVRVLRGGDACRFSAAAADDGPAGAGAEREKVGERGEPRQF
ncbi:hypothetical protein C6W10_21090 [Plantactinospora sp. BB1]|nr:hypothetical protein C6W10_21090 [Plantactinospora sp. BB1]